MIWVIGDIHGYIVSYEGILRRLHKQDSDAITFQVGDMGVGFNDGTPFPKCGENDFFIAGNHDDALMCQKVPGFLGDFGVKEIGDERIFYMGGADSYDKAHRTEGVDWWAYEELTYQQMTAAIQLYRETSPTMVITHDCPQMPRQAWFPHCPPSRTSQCLTQMFEIWQPPFWCFGHHHRPRYGRMNGTYFMCIETLQNKKVQEQKMFAAEEEEEAFQKRKGE